MADVIIEKLNESFVRVECDEDLQNKLYIRYSIYSDGYIFSKLYKKHLWDGKIHAFSNKTGVLPIGFLCDLLEYLKKEKVDYKCSGFHEDELVMPIDEEWYSAVTKENMKNTPKEIRDYQDKAIRSAWENKKCVLLSCTGSGKSLMIYNLCRMYINKYAPKILIVVPNKGLVEQMYKDFKTDYGWTEIDDYCERLYGELKENVSFKKRILISTWQSLYKKSKEFFEDYGMVVCDECHQSKSKELTKIVKACVNATFKIGTTGTLANTKSDAFLVKSILGEVRFELKSMELIEEGVLTDCRIANIVCKYPMDFIENNKSRTYDEEVRMVESYEDRNKSIKFILDHIKPTDNCLVLVNHIEHMKIMRQWLEHNYPERKLHIISGAVKGSKREEIRVGMEYEDGAILLATFATVCTGVNIPKLHEVVLYSNSRSKIRVLQSIGRGLRKHKTKNKVVIFDIVDDLRYKTKLGTTKKNYLVEHWLERVKYYNEQDFKMSTMEMNI